MEPIHITVRSGSGSYAVSVGDGLTARLDALLDAAGARTRVFVISSPLIWQLHGRTMTDALPKAEPILIPDGERFKTLQTVTRVYESLIRAEADRTATILAFGGGVIGDLVGFAAATFLRGVALVQVPTTLLAQVDSSIGGKVGVNHALGKNLVGAFHPPRAVVVDPQWLETLPRREFRAGLYEIVKYGVIASPDLFDRVRRETAGVFKRDPAVLVPIIVDSCRIKAAVVTADERESDLRRTLNFGHTAGHAIEAVTKYRRFRHGEAVAYGMLIAADIAVARGMLGRADRQALADVIAHLGPLPPIADLSVKQILQTIRRDKKVLAGRLHVVLPTAIGQTAIVDDVSEKEIELALRKAGMKH